MSDVGAHSTEEDCWVTIGTVDQGGPFVYDVTKYLDEVSQRRCGLSVCVCVCVRVVCGEEQRPQ